MHSAVEVLQKEFAGLRTGRASVSLLERSRSKPTEPHAAAAGGDDRRSRAAHVDRAGWDRGVVRR